MELAAICHELNNWFDYARYIGIITIENGELSAPYLQDKQFFRIVGSVFNDGIYRYPAHHLQDETFDGAIWAMAVPPEVIALAAEIEAWKGKYQTIDSPSMSPFSSESFGGYSYTKASGASGNGSADSGSWQSQFKSRLDKWRKIRP